MRVERETRLSQRDRATLSVNMNIFKYYTTVPEIASEKAFNK